MRSGRDLENGEGKRDRKQESSVPGLRKGLGQSLVPVKLRGMILFICIVEHGFLPKIRANVGGAGPLEGRASRGRRAMAAAATSAPDAARRR